MIHKIVSYIELLLELIKQKKSTKSTKSQFDVYDHKTRSIVSFTRFYYPKEQPKLKIPRILQKTITKSDKENIFWDEFLYLLSLLRLLSRSSSSFSFRRFIQKYLKYFQSTFKYLLITIIDKIFF